MKNRTPYPEHWHQVGEHRIRGVDVGEGPVVVLLHGLGSYLEEYHDLTERLSPHFRVLVWDQPGDGLSSTPDRPQSLKDRADVVAQVIEHLGVQPVFLMGASQGGFVALKLLAHHPKLVKKALLISPAGGWSTKPLLSRFLLEMAENPLREPFYWATAFIQINMCYAWDYPGRWEKVTGHLREVRERDVPQISQNYFRATAMALGDSVLEDVSSITTPVRLLWGEHDYGMPPSQGRAIHARLPGSELTLVPDCGHAMATEMPDFVLSQAKEWFLGK